MAEKPKAGRRGKPFVLVTLAAFLAALPLFFTTLDKSIFDLFLRTLPSLTEHETVFVLTLDDDSIELAGGFPFRRDVMGDVVLLLTEIGVNTIAFDLAYLDESPMRFDPIHAAGVFGGVLDSGFDALDEAAESGLLLDEIRFLHGLFREELEAALSTLARDADEHFARALAFSDRSWLTLTMIRPEDLLVEGVLYTDEKTARFLSERVALKNVIDSGDTKTPEMVGVMPAIHRLLGRARGAGFVNSNPDADGLRRRVHFLLRYRGDYYGHLALMALQDKLDLASIEVCNRAIVLNMNDGGSLRVPRAQDGSVLLQWPRKTFRDYRAKSLIALIQHTLIEPVFTRNIAVMHDTGFFLYWDEETTPREHYLEARRIMDEAFARNAAAPDRWHYARREFFRSAGAFLNGSFEQAILADVGGDPETAEFVQTMFAAARSQFDRLDEIRGEMTALRNAFVVIGADATSMPDNGLITFQENFPLVGTYYTVANMLLSGEFLDDAPWFASAIVALVWALLIGFLVTRFDTFLSIVSGVSGMVLLVAAFLVFFWTSRIYLGLAVPLAASTLAFVSLMVGKFLTVNREKAFLHGAFSRYLAPEVITEIINDPDKLNLGGEKREMTAMFTDIQGFATISEQLDPTQLVKLLNRYLTAMSNIIMENVGTVDKYEGDAIIAFYGAPVFRPDHPALACRSAIAMKAAERELNRTIVAEGLSPVPLFTRIGINTGDMVVGNMGAENKMDYTIMGNAVNLAARLEGVNKQYRTGGILISEYTRAKIGDEFPLRRLDRVRVVGVSAPLRLYEIPAENVTAQLLETWERAIDLYESRDFASALWLFNSIMQARGGDGVAELFAGRCETYVREPPPEDWDAVRNLTEK